MECIATKLYSTCVSFHVMSQMNGNKYMCALLCIFIMQLLPGGIEDIISDQYYSKITSYPINGEPNALST